MKSDDVDGLGGFVVLVADVAAVLLVAAAFAESFVANVDWMPWQQVWRPTISGGTCGTR